MTVPYKGIVQHGNPIELVRHPGVLDGNQMDESSSQPTGRAARHPAEVLYEAFVAGNATSP